MRRPLGVQRAAESPAAPHVGERRRWTAPVLFLAVVGGVSAVEATLVAGGRGMDGPEVHVERAVLRGAPILVAPVPGEVSRRAVLDADFGTARGAAVTRVTTWDAEHVRRSYLQRFGGRYGLRIDHRSGGLRGMSDARHAGLSYEVTISIAPSDGGSRVDVRIGESG